MSDLYDLLPQADPSQGPWVLVSLIAAEGSTYRRVGARLLVNAAGHLGLISGGCLEADVAARCRPVLDGEAANLEMIIDTRRLLGCDGRLTLIAEPLPSGLSEAVAELKANRKSAFAVTQRPGPDWQPTRVVATAQDRGYCQALLPQRRLLVFGSTPDAPPLLSMASILGWQCQQVVLASDPRSRGAEQSWTVLPDGAAVRRLDIDRHTACVVMNHHVGRDLELLSALWETDSPFLGLLGSRKRRDQILEQLSFGRGASLNVESRILYAPVGLALGAEGAAAIALEICAQVQGVFTQLESASAGGSTKPDSLDVVPINARLAVG